MNQHKFSTRVWAMVVAVAVVIGIFAVRLHNVQITQAAELSDAPEDSFTYLTRVRAARGAILDRNGKVLIGNRAAYSLTLVREVVFSAEDPNENLRQLTNLCAELGLEFTDHFPVTKEKPYEYTTDDYSSTWNSYFKTFLTERDWDTDISAPQLIRSLRNKYHLPEDWTEEEVRRVISVRYELDLRRYTSLPTYVLLEDVDAISLAALTELNIPGLNVETTTVREYYTDLAAHILGRTGPMDAKEYEYYKELGYAMDARVGKEGVEKAFEEDLHGTDGLRVTTISTDGTVLKEYYDVAPVAGNNVELTIDLNYQRAAEEALAEYINNLRQTGVGSNAYGKDVEGGAVVVMEVKTGEVLACASYPTFHLATYSEDFNDLVQQEDHPLVNRALQAQPPGSTFKMATTIAAVDSGGIDPNFKVTDEGIYLRFQDVGYTPRCMLYTTQKLTHGSINVMEALSVSCNYYFYEVGWMTGIEAIDKVAQQLGLGEPTGIELPEETGQRANPETKDALYEGDTSVWYGGDTISAAIGQSEHRYTPLQLCSYIAAIANKGVRYKATILSRVLSSDYQELLRDNEPQIASTLEISDKAYQAYSDGMRMAVTSGTVSNLANYPIAVCAKTGTAEHGSGGSDHASLVVYAPMDDPQIAIAIYLEKGAQGGALSVIARAILDVYRAETGAVDTVPAENRLG